jgi:transposase
MEHVGIDLGATKSSLCVLDAKGKVVEERVVPTVELATYLKGRKGRAVMESCTQSRRVAEAARAAGLEVVVVPGVLVRQLGVGARGIKTDAKDAAVLAQASLRNAELPSVRPCCERSRGHRNLIRNRQQLVGMRTKCVAAIKTHLRGELIVLVGRAVSSTFRAVVETALMEHPDGIPLDIQLLLETHTFLTTKISQLDASIAAIVKDDQVCQRLMTMPGVGPIVSLAFASLVDEISQFPSAEHLASYLALVPGESTTGYRIKRTGVIKAGPRLIRSVLLQAAWSMWRSQPTSPIVVWAQKIAERRGRKVAALALARKMTAVLYAMWKTGKNYDLTRPSPRAEVPAPVAP